MSLPTVAGDANVVRLEPQKVKLTSLGEEVVCRLPELRPNRSYSIPLLVENGTGQRIEYSKISTSCGCLVATAADNVPIDPGAIKEIKVVLEVELSKLRNGIDRRVVFMQSHPDRAEDIEIVPIRLLAAILPPVKVAPERVDFQRDDVESTVDVVVSAVADDVSLIGARLALVTGWNASHEVVHTEREKLHARVRVAPRSKEQVEGELVVRFSYVDKHGEFIAESPITLYRTPKLSVRPAFLRLPAPPQEDKLQFKLFLAGEFEGEDVEVKVYVASVDTDEARVSIPLSKEPLLVEKARPFTNRNAILNCAVDKILEPRGHLLVCVGQESVFVPYLIEQE